MTQAEINKNRKQLAKTNKLQSNLLSIDTNKKLTKVELNGNEIFASSPVSPIGKAFAGKAVNDKVSFQGKEYLIISID